MTVWQQVERFRRTKTYDLIAAAPMIAWVGYGVFVETGNIQPHLRLMDQGTETLLGALQALVMLLAILFYVLMIMFFLTRTVPQARAPGLAPRALAVAGTFVSSAFMFLTPVTLPLWLEIAAAALIAGTLALEAVVLLWLGKSFAIMAEARQLVTGGPYALVRHPLYAAEILGTLAMLIQYFGWAAAALFATFAALQVARSIFEERILGETFAEYGAYRARTARFIPFVC